MEKLSTFKDFDSPHTYTYLMEENAEFKSLLNFFKSVKEGKAKEHFKS